MTEDEPEAVLKELNRLQSHIMPLMAGIDFKVQGALIADLLSIYLIGFPDFEREAILAGLLACARGLTPINERLRYKGEGHPQNQGGSSDGSSKPH